ncbi:hypothetical protein [Pseudomonas serbica]
MTKKYLLVSEGPTDHVVITEVANKISTTLGISIEIIELSPQRDATSGTYPGHGWGGIKSWCTKYSQKEQADVAHLPLMAQQYLLRQNWRALLAFNNAEGIIIQLDTDIAHLLADSTPYVPGTCRKAHCNTNLLFWLNEPSASAQLYFAVTAYAIETWLLATFPPTNAVFSDLPQNFNYEEISDVEDRLITLGFAAAQKRGRSRIRKSPYTIYEPYGKLIANHLPAVRERCSAAEDFCRHLET